jgi:hypothetical protein
MSNDTENQPKLTVNEVSDGNDPEARARLKRTAQGIGGSMGILNFKLKKGESLIVEQEEEEEQELDTEDLLEKLDELGVSKLTIMDHFEIPTQITVTVEDNYGSVISTSEVHYDEWEEGSATVEIDTDDMRSDWFDDFNTSVSVEVECHNTGVRLPIDNEDWESDLVNIKVDLTNYGEESKESLKETVEVEVKEELKGKLLKQAGKQITMLVNEAFNPDTKE